MCVAFMHLFTEGGERLTISLDSLYYTILKPGIVQICQFIISEQTLFAW